MRNICAIAAFSILFAMPAWCEDPTLAAGAYYLSDSQMHSLRQAALSGDAESAARLSEFFSIYENDREAGEFWQKLAAELGSCDAVIDVRYGYESARKTNLKQMSYWTKRARELNCKE